MAHANSLPWYREPWPWIVMAGPAKEIATNEDVRKSYLGY